VRALKAAILVINPVGHSRWDEQDRRIYESFASPGTSVTVTSLPRGPASIEEPKAYAEVLPLIVEKALENRDKYDAIIVNCFLDPGVDLLRGMIRKPVVGPCEASLALASMMARRIGIVTVGGDALWMIEDRVRGLGYGDKVIALEGIRLGVLDIDKDMNATLCELAKGCRRALSKGAEAIVLGCTGLAGLARSIKEEIGAPVIDPAGAALKVAEGLVTLSLRVSKGADERV